MSSLLRATTRNVKIRKGIIAVGELRRSDYQKEKEKRDLGTDVPKSICKSQGIEQGRKPNCAGLDYRLARHGVKVFDLDRANDKSGYQDPLARLQEFAVTDLRDLYTEHLGSEPAKRWTRGELATLIHDAVGKTSSTFPPTKRTKMNTANPSAGSTKADQETRDELIDEIDLDLETYDEVTARAKLELLNISNLNELIRRCHWHTGEIGISISIYSSAEVDAGLQPGGDLEIFTADSYDSCQEQADPTLTASNSDYYPPTFMDDF
ncbi:hypothetical protein QFC21_007315 [Naganishia friedmannii]|uniref:Uncharacterized protein n=2 Tax=Naganishia friedmannii TaxID=89922 RepID=A0ACC2UWL2_9TREE|nr:hypothetical protein QFC21_007361 [Naganishia friedmannii]KAJ9091109.1 hypothetical protein QFC21_007315 [Naganishia friedmannii]